MLGPGDGALFTLMWVNSHPIQMTSGKCSVAPTLPWEHAGGHQPWAVTCGCMEHAQWLCPAAGGGEIVLDEPGLVQRYGGRRHINAKLCTMRHVQGLQGLLFPLGSLWGCFLGIILTPLNCSLQLWNQQCRSETVFLVSFPLKLMVSTPKISRQGGFWSVRMDEDVCCSQQDPCSTPNERKENKSLHCHQNQLW